MSVKISGHTNAATPVGMRLYAAGDIHGRLDLLERLLGLIEIDRAGRGEAETVLVFLGDYIDRGRHSKGVVSRLIGGLSAGITPVFLKGNHEDFLLRFLDRPDSGLDWLQNGGDAALLSYGVEREVIQKAYWRDPEALMEASGAFRAALPNDHLQFFRALKLSYRAGDYFFAHAGVKPGIALDSQRETDLIWIRDEFLSCRDDFGAVVVHGHTPVRNPEDLVNRIGIDTLAFHTGKLTAVGLEGHSRWFLTT